MKRPLGRIHKLLLWRRFFMGRACGSPWRRDLAPSAAEARPRRSRAHLHDGRANLTDAKFDRLTKVSARMTALPIRSKRIPTGLNVNAHNQDVNPRRLLSEGGPVDSWVSCRYGVAFSERPDCMAKCAVSPGQLSQLGLDISEGVGLSSPSLHWTSLSHTGLPPPPILGFPLPQQARAAPRAPVGDSRVVGGCARRHAWARPRWGG